MGDEASKWSQIAKILDSHKVQKSLEIPQIANNEPLKWDSKHYEIIKQKTMIGQQEEEKKIEKKEESWRTVEPSRVSRGEKQFTRE